MRAWMGVLLTAGLLWPEQVAGRREEAEPAVGRLLVAGRELRDPNFAQTVVLLVSYGRSGAMGLILNRKTGATVGKVMESVAEASNAADPVYEGGPVRRGGVLALVRMDRKLEDSTRVVGNVQMASSREVVAGQVRNGARGDVLRLYAGYSGWGAGQLEREIESGAWHVFNGDAAAAFDGEIETLWNRFIRRTELRFAGLR